MSNEISLAKWEKIEAATWRTGNSGATSTDNVQVLRLEVPGGWIYMVNGGPVFVPFPITNHQDKDNMSAGYDMKAKS